MATFDWSDVKYYQPHPYLPYIASFRNNDEIRITVNSQDLYTVPGDSSILIEGTVTYAPKTEGAPADDGTNVILSNNAPAFFFDQIRYELNGVEIDRSRHVGLTSTAQTLLTCTKDEASALEIAGWGAPSVEPTDKSFSFLVPLEHYLGFARGFKGCIVRQKQELVLIRSRTDKNAYTLKAGAEADAVTINITKVEWYVPHVKFNFGPEKVILDKVQNNASFQIEFCSWETHEYPQLPANNKETWKLMTTNNVEAPVFIVLLFQTARLDDERKDASKFDHVKLRSFKVRLNNVTLPYVNFNEDFDRNKFLFFYQNYLNFMPDFSNGEKLREPPLTMNKFKADNPMFAMKLLYEDIIKPGTLDIQIEMEARANFLNNTSVHAICGHRVMYSYQSLTGTVKRIR